MWRGHAKNLSTDFLNSYSPSREAITLNVLSYVLTIHNDVCFYVKDENFSYK